MSEVNFMVCARVDEIDEPIENSTTTACVECGCDIWISPESRKVMREKKAFPCCGPCALRLAGEHHTEIRSVPGIDGTGLNAGQIQELEQALEKTREMHQFAESMGMSFDELKNKAEKIIEAGIGEDTDHFEALKITARLAAKEMTNPEQSWGSTVIMEDYDRRLSPPLPFEEMCENLGKEMVANNVLPSLALAVHAKRVIFALEAWGLQSETERIELTGPISEHPDKMEMLVLLDVRAVGVVKMSRAEIKRDGISPPSLSEWEDEEPESGKHGGLFVEALIPTLQLIKQLHDQQEGGSM